MSCETYKQMFEAYFNIKALNQHVWIIQNHNKYRSEFNDNI